MKLYEIEVEGVFFYVPEWTKVVAIDTDGEVYAFDSPPVFNSKFGIWGEGRNSKNAMPLGWTGNKTLFGAYYEVM